VSYPITHPILSHTSGVLVLVLVLVPLATSSLTSRCAAPRADPKLREAQGGIQPLWRDVAAAHEKEALHAMVNLEGLGVGVGEAAGGGAAGGPRPYTSVLH
jgi:hypothetical protein